jgi:hypothetical protein
MVDASGAVFARLRVFQHVPIRVGSDSHYIQIAFLQQILFVFEFVQRVDLGVHALLEHIGHRVVSGRDDLFFIDDDTSVLVHHRRFLRNLYGDLKVDLVLDLRDVVVHICVTETLLHCLFFLH